MIRFGSASVRRDELKNVKARSLISNFEKGDVKRDNDEPVPTTPKSPDVEEETAKPGTTKKLLAAFQQFDQPGERKEPVKTPSKKGPPKRWSWMNGANEGEQKKSNNTEAQKPEAQQKQAAPPKTQPKIEAAVNNAESVPVENKSQTPSKEDPKPVEQSNAKSSKEELPQELKAKKNEPEVAKPQPEEPNKEAPREIEQPKETPKAAEPPIEESKQKEPTKEESKLVPTPEKEPENAEPKEKTKKPEPFQEDSKPVLPVKEEPKSIESPNEISKKAVSSQEEVQTVLPQEEDPVNTKSPNEEPPKVEPIKMEQTSEEPLKEEVKDDVPSKEEQKPIEPLKEEPRKAEPPNEEPKKAESPKEESKNADSQGEEAKKDETESLKSQKEEPEISQPTKEESKTVELPKEEPKQVKEEPKPIEALKDDPKEAKEEPKSIESLEEELKQVKEELKPIDSPKEEPKPIESVEEKPKPFEQVKESKPINPPKNEPPKQPEQTPPKIELTPAEPQIAVLSANTLIDQSSAVDSTHTMSTSAVSSEKVVTLNEADEIVVSSQVVTTSKVTKITSSGHETFEKVVEMTNQVQSVPQVKKPVEMFSSQKKKKVLLVYVGLPQKTFDAALRDATIASLEEQGCEVVVSDLMKMEFNPVLSIKDIGDFDRDEFDYVEDLASAFKEGKIADDIRVEQEKVKAADLIILHYQTLLHEVPAILMGWLQRVLTPNFAFDVRENQVFDNGLLKGKKAMVSVTYLGPGSAWSERGILGDINVSLWPIQNGILRFCGFDVLKPELTHNVHTMGQEDREATLASWKDRVQGIWNEEAINFIPSKDFDSRNGWLLSDRALSRLMFSPGAPTTGQHLGRPLPLCSQTKL